MLQGNVSKRCKKFFYSSFLLSRWGQQLLKSSNFQKRIKTVENFAYILHEQILGSNHVPCCCDLSDKEGLASVELKVSQCLKLIARRTSACFPLISAFHCINCGGRRCHCAQKYFMKCCRLDSVTVFVWLCCSGWEVVGSWRWSLYQLTKHGLNWSEISVTQLQQLVTPDSMILDTGRSILQNWSKI